MEEKIYSYAHLLALSPTTFYGEIGFKNGIGYRAYIQFFPNGAIFFGIPGRGCHYLEPFEAFHARSRPEYLSAVLNISEEETEELSSILDAIVMQYQAKRILCFYIDDDDENIKTFKDSIVHRAIIRE